MYAKAIIKAQSIFLFLVLKLNNKDINKTHMKNLANKKFSRNDVCCICPDRLTVLSIVKLIQL